VGKHALCEGIHGNMVAQDLCRDSRPRLSAERISTNPKTSSLATHSALISQIPDWRAGARRTAGGGCPYI